MEFEGFPLDWSVYKPAKAPSVPGADGIGFDGAATGSAVVLAGGGVVSFLGAVFAAAVLAGVVTGGVVVLTGGGVDLGSGAVVTGVGAGVTGVGAGVTGVVAGATVLATGWLATLVTPPLAREDNSLLTRRYPTTRFIPLDVSSDFSLFHAFNWSTETLL